MSEFSYLFEFPHNLKRLDKQNLICKICIFGITYPLIEYKQFLDVTLSN